MGSARIVGVLGSLLSLLAAQQQELDVRPALQQQQSETGVFPLPELGRYDTDLPKGAKPAVERLRSLLWRTLVAAVTKPSVVPLANGVPGKGLLIRCTKAGLAEVQGMLEQLQKEAPLQVRLQCSLVTLPRSVASGMNLKYGRMVAADVETVSWLMREAAKNKGTLCNLPEVTAGPLVPFVVEPKHEPDAKEAPTLRLRGEMLPLDDREVVIAMDLVRGELPVDKTREPLDALVQPVFRLQAGQCAMATVFAGETLTVLVVRCVDVAAKAPPVPVGR